MFACTTPVPLIFFSHITYRSSGNTFYTHMPFNICQVIADELASDTCKLRALNLPGMEHVATTFNNHFTNQILLLFPSHTPKGWPTKVWK